MRYLLIFLALIEEKTKILCTQSFISSNNPLPLKTEEVELGEFIPPSFSLSKKFKSLLEYHNENFFRQCFFLQVINLIEPFTKTLFPQKYGNNKKEILEILKLFYHPQKTQILELFTTIEAPTAHLLGDMIYMALAQKKSLPIPLKVDLLKFTLCLYEIPQKNSSLATYEKENGVWDNKQFCCYLELVKYTEGEERQSYEKIAKHFFKNLKRFHR